MVEGKNEHQVFNCQAGINKVIELIKTLIDRGDNLEDLFLVQIPR